MEPEDKGVDYDNKAFDSNEVDDVEKYVIINGEADEKKNIGDATYKVDQDRLEVKTKEDTNANIERKNTLRDDGGIAEKAIGKGALAIPSICVIFMVYIPSLTLIQQFIYDAVAEANNYTYSSTGSESGECSTKETNETIDSTLDDLVQAKSAEFLMMVDVAETIPAFITALLGGPISDSVGRKLFMIMPMAAMTIKFGIYAGVHALGIPFELIIVAHLIEGFGGGIPTVIMAHFSYVADTTNLEQRTKYFALMDAMMYICGSASQVGMGYIIEATDFLIPFYVFIGVSVVSILYILIIIPESRKKQPGMKLLNLKDLKKIVTVMTKPDYITESWRFWLPMGALVACCMTITPRWQIQTLYALGAPLCWGSIKLGYYVALSTMVGNLGSMILPHFFLHTLEEDGIGMIGALSGFAALMLLAFAVNDAMMFTVPIVGFACFIIRPMTSSILSKQASADDQGSLLAGVTTLDSIAGMTGTILVNTIFSKTLDIFIGLAFVVLAAFYAIAFIFLKVYHSLRVKAGRAPMYQSKVPETSIDIKL